MVKPTSIIIPAQIIIGTMYGITQKVLLLQEAQGFAGVRHKFDKPFTQCLLMVCAMMCSLFIRKYWDSNGKGPHPKTSFRTKVILAIPASFDLITTTLNIFGLIYINVSIYQMFRGAHIIFTSLFSILFLKKKITGHEWVGIVIIIVALILIGWSGMYIPGIDGSLEQDTHTAGEKFLGAMLVIIAQVFHATQVILEEYLIRFVGTVGALEVIGNEGFAGLLLLIFVMYPFAFICPGNDPSPLSGGSLENIIDTFTMAFNNGYIILMFFIYIVVAGSYNISAMLCIAFTSSLNEAIVDVVRTLTIWICMLISAAIGLPFGEPWVKYSWMELGGFVLMIIGNFIYNGFIRFPCFKYTGHETNVCEDPISHEPLN
ncbi:Integral membrane protein [Tritrichomonas foetus]|uniref:Integral membrane protein n=1 Tax=Tritrichomonas foetus TaxID=1144522 RepID=A0A1J4KLL1_9EUKA|nr:Integral membrane protein [Tritrichomonas foetus]|eukprot:OHT12026.1 Integral membrane protein [Tritrichomonas foetus]